jgi:crotonobetainyl-CoA:carnitine CoA-transferase CaiB-like acyl-CoA transferase
VGAVWAEDECWSDLQGRLAREDDLDRHLDGWTRSIERDELVRRVRGAGVPCAPVLRPEERCDGNPDNEAWGLWPVAVHSKHGPIRVDGLPVHMSTSAWRISRGGPLLGEDNERVLGEVLGLSTREIAGLADEGVI